MGRLYRSLGEIIRFRFADWHRGLFTGLPEAQKALGTRPDKNITLYNGPLACSLFTFAPKRKKSAEVSVDAAKQAQMFANRLRKNQKHLRRTKPRTASTPQKPATV